ncbi:hypothetical protein QJS10_CPA01g00783 [Acorus calamus]|uniref:P-loop containing nucleoside triphosphate hydrolase protein n=1 Tax=Acorus calamus TaxID=4465 RepID=A0AAV9FFW0_ACOCL|nr:hypothetical protein QJS10_CPA01g00783 [Acorus calamus]
MDPSQPLLVAMKGHPGTGKSTLARAISSSLHYPLLDKDDIRDSTDAVQRSLPPDLAHSLLNDLSYSALSRLAETQLGLGLPGIVVDSPLSNRARLDDLLQVARAHRARVAVVECRPGDEAEWRRRLEARGEGGGEGRRGWHKPKDWEELRRLVEGYGGRADYDAEGVPWLVVDTTARGGEVEGVAKEVVRFLRGVVGGEHD